MSDKRLFMTRKDAAEQIGVSLPTFDELLRREVHPIPSVRIGRRVFVMPDDLRQWAEEEKESRAATHGQAI